MKRILLGLAVVALMLSVVPSVSSCHEYTPGYWKRCVTVYVEELADNSYPADNDGVKESDALMECYERWIRANVFPDFTLELAYELFWSRGHSVQTMRQFLADCFNLAKAACMDA